jgi:hypothetical protein
MAQDFRTCTEFGNTDNPALQGVCKDCGNGTLNNELNPAFEEVNDLRYSESDSYFRCMRCHSTHLDVL